METSMPCIPDLEHLLEEIDSLNTELHFAESKDEAVRVLTMIAAARRDLETLCKE